MKNKYQVIEHEYDVIVVGAGGSGLRATLGMAAEGLKTACITKVFPTRKPYCCSSRWHECSSSKYG
ncbi:MAG: hypothetical protein CM15mP93_09530 [Thiotrichaceae bacterium]|nr:MAG: hypothetical protein CM15mP93_09530 [Thiotrichaceae bacterium]